MTNTCSLPDNTYSNYFTLERKIGYLEIYPILYIYASPISCNSYSHHSIPPQSFPNLHAPALFCNRQVRNVIISIVTDYINILEFYYICLDF